MWEKKNSEKMCDESNNTHRKLWKENYRWATLTRSKTKIIYNILKLPWCVDLEEFC